MSLTPLLFVYLLSCSSAKEIIGRAVLVEGYSQAHVEEIVQVIKESTDLSCDWDENVN